MAVNNGRTHNAVRNMSFGFILKVYQMVCPFILRTAMIYTLGLEYVGLNSLFSSILQVLNLTELGVGSAMVYSMYKPLAEGDDETICCLMNLYKKYYRIIGIIIAFIGVLLTPIIPKLVSQDLPEALNLFYLYWLNLGYTAISYWLFAYKQSVLIASQRTDVYHKVTLVVNTVTYIIQFLLLLVFKNYYLYLIAMLLGQVLINITTAIISTKMFPKYKARGTLALEKVKAINTRIRDLFTSKVGAVIQNSADSIVISAFLGLTILAKYNNYYYIMNSIFGIIAMLLQSCLAGIGNSIVTESSEKNYNDMKRMTFIAEWLIGVCCCCLLCLYQPFMVIWVGEENTLSIGIVVCICIYFFTIATNQMLCIYKDASGMWHEDRFRPLLTALLNLLLNLSTVKFLGLFGVILSTVISMMFFGTPWLLRNLFTVVFKRDMKEYLGRLFLYISVTCVGCFICFNICDLVVVSGIIGVVLRLLICIFGMNFIMVLLYHRLEEFSEAIALANRITKGRLLKIRIFKLLLKN